AVAEGPGTNDSHAPTSRADSSDRVRREPDRRHQHQASRSCSTLDLKAYQANPRPYGPCSDPIRPESPSAASSGLYSSDPQRRHSPSVTLVAIRFSVAFMGL